MNRKLSSRTQIKYGAILSYALIVANALYGLLFSPYLLQQLGESSFGVYKTVASFSSTIMVLDLGLGATVMRYTAKFRGEKKTDEISNFAAMGLIQAAVMAIVVGGVSLGICFGIPAFYAKTFSPAEISLAMKLLAILSVHMMLVVIENVLNGVITGCNHFVFSNGVKLTLLAFRVVATIALLQRWKSAVVLVVITLLCSVVTMVLQLLYIRRVLHIRIRLRKWDFSLFRESLGYTAMMFVQTIAVQVNGNVDNVVISYVIGPAAVAIYSFGIQLFNMYESLAMALSNLMLPSISKRISEGAEIEELQGIVTRVGRMQFIVLGGALGGFICLGKDFISLWLGSEFSDVYYLSLIMMVPVTFELIQNVCLSILRAKNKLGFRTGCLLCATLFNIVFTLIGTRLFNYYAAAVGTGLSAFLGNVIVMNIYYRRKLGFRVLKFYLNVFRRLLLCILIPVAIIAVLVQFCGTSWGWLVLSAAIFVAIYGTALWIYGLNKAEKEFLLGSLKKRI